MRRTVVWMIAAGALALCPGLLWACSPPLFVVGNAPAVAGPADAVEPRPGSTPQAITLTATQSPAPNALGQPGRDATQVTLDIFSGLPDPTWTLTAEQERELRALLAGLPATDCRPLDLQLGYRGFVVWLAQRPELSNEYRLRTYAGQVRYGDPWSPVAPASCLADSEHTVERRLLAGARPLISAELYDHLTRAIESAPVSPSP
jgi:hypothetical protein